MPRTTPNLVPFASRLTAVGLLSIAGCAPIGGDEPSGEPIVGRLQFNDRVVDLTSNSFADGPNAVPKNAVGHVLADIDLREQRDADEAPRKPTPFERLDDDTPQGRGLRR
jgi:hypothetical protein